MPATPAAYASERRGGARVCGRPNLRAGSESLPISFRRSFSWQSPRPNPPSKSRAKVASKGQGEPRPRVAHFGQAADADIEAARQETLKTEELQARYCRRPADVLTTNQGVPVADNQNSLKAGLRGPTLLEDFILREKITHFDHERIPERVVHARGSAAHGYFQVYEAAVAISRRPRSSSDPAKQTPVFVRFSTVAGSRGSADTARDVRGFAVKFYTRRGQLGSRRQQHPGVLHPGCDQVSRPHPCREARAAQRDPAGGVRARHVLGFRLAHARIDAHADVGHVGPRDSAQFRDDGGLRRPHLPARQRQGRVALRQVPLEADEGRPFAGVGRGAEDRRQGRRTSIAAICGRRSSAATSRNGSLGLQIVEEKDEHKFGFDLLDPTKIIPEELVPVQRVGKMVAEPQSGQFLCRDRAGRRSIPATSCRASTSATTRCCKAGSSPISTRRSSASGRTSTNCRSTGRSARSTTTSATAIAARRSTRAGSPTSPIRWAAAARRIRRQCRRSVLRAMPRKIDGAKFARRSPSFGDHFSQATHVLEQHDATGRRSISRRRSASS